MPNGIHWDFKDEINNTLHNKMKSTSTTLWRGYEKYTPVDTVMAMFAMLFWKTSEKK
jgi:hypothetical protein